MCITPAYTPLHRCTNNRLTLLRLLIIYQHLLLEHIHVHSPCTAGDLLVHVLYMYCEYMYMYMYSMSIYMYMYSMSIYMYMYMCICWEDRCTHVHVCVMYIYIPALVAHTSSDTCTCTYRCTSVYMFVYSYCVHSYV